MPASPKYSLRARMRSAIAAILVCTGFASTPSHTARAQEQIDVNLSVQLGGLGRAGRTAHIIIPQSRSFPIISPHPHHPRQLPPPTIEISGVESRIKILEQTASTTLEVSLRNPSSQQAEAVLLLPVPEGAVVSAFLFEGAASEPTAQVLPKDEARKLYDSIVAKLRDPALLEFAGYNLIRSSVFPVPANGTQKVRLTYDHLLSADQASNRIDYLLPRSESLQRRSPWKITADVRSKHPISTVYSPSHEIITTRKSPNHIAITLAEAARLNPGPFRLSYLLEDGPVSASMFAYPDPKVGSGGAAGGENGAIVGGGGYFLLMAGLPASIREGASVKREVTIVIDRSGSMAGPKMDQVKAAALQVIEGLEDGEAFNIIDYSTSISAFAPRPMPKDNQLRLDARQYIAALRPGGGTNIHDALIEALRPEPNKGMFPIVLFLTDGLPTVGQTSEVAIREIVEKGNPHNRRIFSFGVGHDVNVPLLDRIADVTRATTTYVLPDEDVEVKVAQVFRRLYGPVLADAALQTLDADGQVTTRLAQELIPHKLPDLFEGDQLILLGQYRQEKPVTFRLTGNFLGKPRSFEFKFDFSAATTQNAFVPRLWASRRIAYLVDQIRQAGADSAGRPTPGGSIVMSDPRLRELMEEILRLSTEFGILTEYTAFLATEGTDLSDWKALQLGCSDVLEGRAVRERAGVAAVNQGMNFNAQKGKMWNDYDNRYIDAKLNRVEITSVQQVNDRCFFKRGEQWIDSRLINVNNDNRNAAIAPDQTIAYGSPEHLALLQKLIIEQRQGVLSLDGDILIQHEGKNILVQNAN